MDANKKDAVGPYGSRWPELSARLYRFLTHQPEWKLWPARSGGGPLLCSPASWEDKEHATQSRIDAVLADRGLIPSRNRPEFHQVADITPRGWNRLLRGVFVYLGGPAALPDIAAIAAVFLEVSPDPAIDALGNGAVAKADDHLTYAQLDEWVEESLDATSRAAVANHAKACAFCQQQLTAYESAAPLLSESIKKSVPVSQPENEADYAPTRLPEPTRADRLRAFFKSPPQILALLTGLAVVIGGPIFLWQSVAPGTGRDFVEGVPEDANEPLDLSVLESLPPQLYDEARLIVAAGEFPQLPEVLVGLPAPAGVSIIYPVSEATESAQPTLTWQPLAPPPYSIAITGAEPGAAARVILSAENLFNTAWTVTMPLVRGRSYTWQLRASDGSYDEASFVVLDEPAATLWGAMQSQHRDDPLALGVVAQQLGLLTPAEQAFDLLIQQNPKAQQAYLLFENVVMLREP